MMNNNIEARIEELENNGMVIVNVVTFEDGKMNIEFWNGEGTVAYFECITVEQYEANGFDVANVPVQVVEA